MRVEGTKTFLAWWLFVLALGAGADRLLTAQDSVSPAQPKGFVELPTEAGPRVLVQLSQVRLVEEGEGAHTVVDLTEGRLVHVSLGFDEVRQRMAGAR